MKGSQLTITKVKFNCQTSRMPGIRLGNPIAELCNSDLLAESHQAVILQRINYYRRVAGVPSVTLSTNTSVQHAATMILQNGDVSHFPDDSWNCYAFDSVEILKQGSIGFTSNPVALIDFWMNIKPGIGASRDRALLLHPELTNIAAGYVRGTTYAAGAMVLHYQFMEPASKPSTTVLSRDGYVAWPPNFDISCKECVFSISVPTFPEIEKVSISPPPVSNVDIIEQNGWVTYSWSSNQVGTTRSYKFKYDCQISLVEKCLTITHSSSLLDVISNLVQKSYGFKDQYFKMVIGETKEINLRYRYLLQSSDYLIFDPQELGVSYKGYSIFVTPLKPGRYRLVAFPEQEIDMLGSDDIRRRVLLDVSSHEFRQDSWMAEADRLIDTAERMSWSFSETGFNGNRWPSRYFDFAQEVDVGKLRYSESLGINGRKVYGRHYNDTGNNTAGTQSTWEAGGFYCGDLYMVPRGGKLPIDAPPSPYRGAYVRLAKYAEIDPVHPIPCSQALDTQVGMTRRLRFVNPTNDIPYIEICDENLACKIDKANAFVKLKSAGKDYVDLVAVSPGTRKIRVSLGAGRYFYGDITVREAPPEVYIKHFDLATNTFLFDYAEYSFPEMFSPPSEGNFVPFMDENNGLVAVYREYTNSVRLLTAFNTGKSLSCVYLIQGKVATLLGSSKVLAASVGIGNTSSAEIGEACPDYIDFVADGKLP